MDYNQAFAGLVESLSAQILTSVQEKVDADIARAINNAVSQTKVDQLVAASAERAAKVAAAEYKPDLTEIDRTLSNAANGIVKNISVTAEKLIGETVKNYISQLDFNQLTENAISHLLDEKLKSFTFPEKSIKASSIDFDTNISGDNVNGGIIHNFASDGIDDKASRIQVTILDTHTVVENELLTRDLTIKNSTKLEGDIYLNGNVVLSSPGFVTVVDAATEKVRENLNNDLFSGYSDVIFGKIKEEGLDLSRITLHGEEIVKDGQLSNGITTSNLKRVGVLDDLQVKGETLIANTFFVGARRIGINTLEPTFALTVWDEEVEIIAGKKQGGIAQLGSTRNQALLLTTNLKNNLLLNPDGSVTITQLNLGKMNVTSAASPPNYNAPKATVVFNENPTLGGPLGWVSLGDARWANFGIIE